MPLSLSVIVVIITLSILVPTVVQAVEPRTAASMRQLRQARQCLPSRVTNMTDYWLKHVRDIDHRRQLESITLEQLEVRLKSGEEICQAVRGALQRVTNHHRHVMQQRAAEGVGQPVLEGSGWDETMRLLYDAWAEIVPQCQQKLLPVAPDKLESRTLAECISKYKFHAFVAALLDNLEE